MEHRPLKRNKKIEYWKNHLEDEELLSELTNLIETDEDALFDAFYRNLEFGTAGLRDRKSVV